MSGTITPAQSTPTAGEAAKPVETPVAATPAAAAAPVEGAPITSPPIADAKPAEGVKPPESAAKPDETKPPEQKPIVPEKYDLKLPEQSLLNPKHLEKVSEYAKQNSLTQEQAQALVQREHEAVSSFVNGQEELIKERESGWLEAIKSDKEIGGDNLNESLELSKRLIDKYGSDALKNELKVTGYGNHPEMVRFVSRLARASAEGKIIPANTMTGGGKKDAAEILYGNKT